jgi:hypothetical protein
MGANKTSTKMKEYYFKLKNVHTFQVVEKRVLLPVKDGQSSINQIGKIKNGILLVDCFEIK